LRVADLRGRTGVDRVGRDGRATAGGGRRRLARVAWL